MCFNRSGVLARGRKEGGEAATGVVGDARAGVLVTDAADCGEASTRVFARGRQEGGEGATGEAFAARSGVRAKDAGDCGEEAVRVVFAPRLAGV